LLLQEANLTKAFDTALFIPSESPDVGQAVGIDQVGPPFDTSYYFYVIAPGPGVTLGASVPAATDVGQILVSGPGPNFQWLTQYELYLGALPAAPSTNPAPGAPTPPPAGAMYYNTSDNTPYILTFPQPSNQATWVPLPVATTNRVTVAASLPAATGMGQMLLSGPQGNPGGATTFPWTASVGYFLGAHPTPPIQNVAVGSMYYNTANNQLYVWNGSSWQTITTPAKASTASLFYQSVLNQMVYPTTTPDLFGQTYAPTAVEAIEIYLNGVRLTPSGGTIPGDYTFNYATSTLTLATIPPTGSIVAIDILQDPLSLGPTLILREMLMPLVGFDGVETTFDLIATSGTNIVVNDPVDLNVLLDGVMQEPGVDYVLSTNGSQIIFSVPPTADAACFIVYFSKSAQGFLSVVTHDLTMYGDGTAANPLGAVLSSEDALLPGIVYVPPTGIGGTNNAINLAPDGAISVEVDTTTGLVVSPGAPNPLTGMATGSTIAVNLDAGSAHDFTGAGELTLIVATQAQVDAGTDNANPVTSLTLAQSTSLDTRYVNLTGDTMTGPLNIPIPPANPDEVTNKQYVDESIASSMLYQGVWHVAANTPDLTPAVMNPLNGWSWISETVNPDVPEIAPAGLPGIGGLSIDSGDRVLWDAGSAAYDLVKGSSLSITEARSLFVEVAGDTMTGNLTFATGQQFLFAADMSGIQRSSFGPLTLQQGNGGEQPQICDVFGLNNRDIIDTINGDARYVNVTGDTMTGPLVLNADPTIGPQAATRNYVDTSILALEALKVDRAGDAMTGPLLLPGQPTLALHATPRSYVDNQITTNSLWKGVYLPSLNFPDLNPASMNPQDGWTWFIQTQDPNLPEIIPPGVPGLSGMSVDSGWIVWWNAGASQYQLTRGPDLSMSTALATFVNLTGDTMVGDLNFPALVGLNLAGAKIVSSGPQLYIQRPIGDNQPQILNFAGNQANNIIDASGSSPMTGNLTFPTDGQGITLSSGGMVYKKVGTGLTLRRHVQNTEIGIENNDGTNRQNILTAATGMGIGTGVLKTGDTMTGTLTINTGNLTVSGVTTLNNSVIVNNASVRTTNNQGMYVDGNSNTSASNGFVVRGSNGSEFCRWYGDAVGYNGPAEARAHCATWNGGWSYQDCWYTVVNSPPTLYANGVVSCQSLTQRSGRENKLNIRDVRSSEVQDAWSALKVRRFRWKDTPIPPDPMTGKPLANPSPPPPQSERFGFIADELPEAVVAYAAPGSSDPAKQVHVREGWDVGDMVALCVAKIKELEAEITALKGAR
jgi:hypothetical protein